MIHRKKIKFKSKDTGYWKSYSDMMAALLLVFILIVTVTLGRVEDQKKDIEELIGVKPEIIKELREELADFEVKIDQDTGDITFRSDILFEYNKDELLPEGIEFLSKFIPKYIGVILNEKYADKIAEVIIEGHTDTDGSYTSNLQLSQARALSVAKFVVGENSNLISEDAKKRLQIILTATGKSETHPVYVEGSEKVVDAEKSRRVELKFRVAEDEAIKKIEELIR